jgi:GH25 family lysozyme M1 (1,4-beta-N-acetylmuramidase)
MKKLFLILLSTLFVLSSVVTANGAVMGENYVGSANDVVSTGATSSNAWSKTDKGYVNDNGDVIEGATMKGIDVSQWNGDIDWSAVAKSDVDFAIIRCGYGSDILSQDDKYFEANIKGCIENKIPFGIYLYSYAVNEEMALSEADHVLRLIKGYNLNFPVFYDMEDDSQLSYTDEDTNKKVTVSNSERGKIATTFCNEILNNGFEVGIYANLNWWTNYLTDSAFNNTTWYKWVAQYNHSCAYTKPYVMWQCTSTGSVDGISGNVDLNFWYDKVRTNDDDVSVTVVKLNKTSYTSIRKTKNTTFTLKATVKTTGQTGVTWKTSNKNVAVVNSAGKVTCKSKGSCYITATAKDGSKRYARCKVTVVQRVTKIKLNKTSYKLSKKGSTVKLKATCTPTKANSKKVSWKSTKTKVATVNSSGKVTAKKKGTCYIVATTKDGSKLSAKCKITVKK